MPSPFCVYAIAVFFCIFSPCALCPLSIASASHPPPSPPPAGNWVSAYQGLTLADCPIGIQLAGNAAGGILLLDSSATNVPLVFQTTGSKHLFIERFTGVNVTMVASSGLNCGGSCTVPGWRQGPSYTNGGSLDPGTSGPVALTRPDAPLERRARPTFDDAPTAPVNALTFGAVGDGKTDCTAALQRALAAPGSPPVFLPYGSYLVRSTITMPAGGALVGELGSVLLADATSPAFANADAPTPLLSVPAGATGVRLVDLLFSATGDAPGLVYLDWRAPPTAPSGLWDVSWRLYHAASDLFVVAGPGAGVYFEEGWGCVRGRGHVGAGARGGRGVQGRGRAGACGGVRRRGRGCAGAGESWCLAMSPRWPAQLNSHTSSRHAPPQLVGGLQTTMWTPANPSP